LGKGRQAQSLKLNVNKRNKDGKFQQEVSSAWN
jgi:hypothetical protein